MVDKQTDAKQDEENDNVAVSLYEKHQKLYVREVHGIFAKWRFIAMSALLGFYYITPWLRWDGNQAVLLDLPARKFHILGITFWPQDFVYLAILLIIAAMALFFFTAVAGRLWCGYACPQTVWTEIFMWIERKIEGGHNKQKKRDNAKWTPLKFYIKSTKHLVWGLFALWTGFTFVGYFTPIIDLGISLFTWEIGTWEFFWIVFYGFATWGNAGFMREQVCIYMCPYARFQSAMFDQDTMIISYDEERGEPRGGRKKSTDLAEASLGSCVDCSMCVQVCPTGIDIRDGLQYQCIGCAACVDVCDTVMDKMGYDKGLIKYTTLRTMEGEPTNMMRPKVVGYAAMLVLASIAVLVAVLMRIPLNMDVMRDRASLYRETDEGLIQNVYTLRIMNMDTKSHVFKLSADGLDDLEMEADREILSIEAGQITELTVRLNLDPELIEKRSSEVFFHLDAMDGSELNITQDGRFLGPL